MLECCSGYIYHYHAHTLYLVKMMNYQQYFKGKKIIMLGLGLLGRGIGVAKFLAEQGAILTITDLKTKKELAPALKKLKKYKGINYVLGGHQLVDFSAQGGPASGGPNMVIKAAGVPLNSPFVAEARKNNIPIKMDASLFLELAPKIISVGVTGTRGKSTVTQLIYTIIKNHLKSKKNDHRQVYLGGNVRGLATLPLLKKIKKGDIVVFELDSWQLQGFGDYKVSPNIAVFTNLMPYHLNYYQGSMKQYFYDKVNIYRWQTEKDFLVVGKTISPLIRKNGRRRSKLIESGPIDSSLKSKLLGKHNLENIKLAIIVAGLLKIPEPIIKPVVESFKGVPGRLELVREVKGVRYYNDTTATMPEATLAALKALSQYQGKIILIGGGNDKALDYKKYATAVSNSVKKLILFSGLATDKIKSLLPPKFKKNIIDAGSMTEAVSKAVAVATEGDVIILSPGATSFGLFKNEYDRGDQFVNLVKKLK